MALAVILRDQVNILFSMIIIFIVEYLIYRYLKKFITEPIIIEMDSASLTIKSKQQRQVLMKEIEDYNIVRYNGIRFELRLKGNKKIRLLASAYFGEPKGLESFCDNFEAFIHDLNVTNRISIKRKKSFLETKAALILLITFSTIAVGAIIIMFIQRKAQEVLIGSIGMLFSLWTAYFVTQKKLKK